MKIDTPLMEEALANMSGVVASMKLPDLPAQREFQGLRYYEVHGPLGEPLLLAFGLVPLVEWLALVNHHYQETGLGEQPWDPEDPDKVVDSLNRLRYERVAVDLNEEGAETPFTIQWGTEGIVPVTLWAIAFESPEEESD